MTKLLGLCGSLRAASASAAVARALAENLAPRATLEMARIGDLPHYNADIDGGAPVARLIAQIEAADGLVFVTPEYNYSVPGVLKNAIDWASRPAYQSVFKHKPSLVITVSGGALGGARAQSHLKYILNGMLADTHVGQEILVPHANHKVEDGRFSDAATLDFALAEIESFIGALRA